MEMKMVRALAVGVILALAALLGACGSKAPTSLPSPTPYIRWPTGEPSSPLEDDPAVKAVRAAHLAIAWAVNAHYFADPSFQDNTMTEEYRRVQIGAFPDMDHGWYVYPGPAPFEPLEVTNPEPGVYEVRVCQDYAWRQYAPGREPHYDGDAVETVYTVRDFNGHLLLDDEDVYESTPCDPSMIKRGYFDPAPVLDLTLKLDEVRWTDGNMPTMQVTGR